MGVVLCGCCGKCLVSPMITILLSKDNYILNLTRNKNEKN
nr:MAG TPA: Recombinase zinc beta ribbon domain [Caudoviricetes sp.]